MHIKEEEHYSLILIILLVQFKTIFLKITLQKLMEVYFIITLILIIIKLKIIYFKITLQTSLEVCFI